MVTTLILLSAVLHASWNAFVKSDGDRTLSFAWIMGLGGLASVAAIPFVGLPDVAAWKYLAATTVLQNIYFVLVLLSYRHGDLSQAYPIARGTAALLAAVVSSLLGLDHLESREWAGIVISSLGIASLALSGRGSLSTLRRAVGYPLLSGACTAAYSIVDGMGARVSASPFTYVVWMNICTAPLLPLFVLVSRRRQAFQGGLVAMGPRLSAAIVAMASYSIAVWAFSQSSLGRIAVLRETSVLFAALMGSFILKEPFGTRRLLSAAAIVLGFLLWP